MSRALSFFPPALLLVATTDTFANTHTIAEEDELAKRKEEKASGRRAGDKS